MKSIKNLHKPRSNQCENAIKNHYQIHFIYLWPLHSLSCDWDFDLVERMVIKFKAFWCFKKREIWLIKVHRNSGMKEKTVFCSACELITVFIGSCRIFIHWYDKHLWRSQKFDQKNLHIQRIYLICVFVASIKINHFYWKDVFNMHKKTIVIQDRSVRLGAAHKKNLDF